MYFLCIVGIVELEAQPLRWIMVVFFYALSLLIENCINLVFYNGECQRGVSPPLLKKKNLVLASNVLATSVYPLLRHFY